jgi:hypothetical protein
MTSRRKAKKEEKKAVQKAVAQGVIFAEYACVIVNPDISLDAIKSLGIAEDIRGIEGLTPLVNSFAKNGNSTWSRFLFERSIPVTENFTIKEFTACDLMTSWLKPINTLEMN